MKMLLIVYGGPRAELVPDLLERHHVEGYTEMPRAHGAGSTGRREGSRAWPGDSVVFFSLAPDDRARAVLDAVGHCSRECVPGERIHAALMPVEAMV
ncbi:MAG TPA: hypothetical protein VFY20_04960 [Gemmatimonadales bacterium]|nr:hypothetical protein [Gemmatimonadales bacterium]